MTDTTNAERSPAGPPVIPEDERVLTRAGHNRRAELLFHAERLFREHGYANTRMVDIASAAGVTKGNLYWYFDTKEALARELAVDARDRIRVAQRDAVEGLEHPLDILYVGTVAATEFSLHESALWSSVGGLDDPGIRETIAASSLIHAGDAGGTFRLGQQTGVVRDDEDPIALGFVAEGIVNQMVVSVMRGHLEEADGIRLAARSVVRMAAATHELATEAIARCETP